MLSISEIEKSYSGRERLFKRNMLREYMQCLILKAIFNSPVASKLSFLGGTAIRIVYGNPRFSEDLDFDNFSLSQEDFILLGTFIEKKLAEEGYKVETKNVFKGAYRCYINISDVLFQNGISPHENEKLMIQVDTLAHDFVYERSSVILDKFDIVTEIFVTPIDLLLSQKIIAAMERERPQGRDFFDIIFLMSRTKPNYQYLTKKLGISGKDDLKRVFIERVGNFDFEALMSDVGPFLYNQDDDQKIKLFKKYIDQAEF